MMEALDPNYDSELARSMMDACARLLDADLCGTLTELRREKPISR
jgi:hypothetical protein